MFYAYSVIFQDFPVLLIVILFLLHLQVLNVNGEPNL